MDKIYGRLMPLFLYLGSRIGNLSSYPLPAFPIQSLKKVTDGSVLVSLVTHRQVRVDTILDAPAHLLLSNIPLDFEVSNYFTCCPLSNAYRHREFSSCDSRMFGNNTQHQSMIGKKCPSWHNLIPLQRSPLE